MTTKQTPKTRKADKSVQMYTVRYGRKTVHFILDKVVIFRLMQRLGNRLWGISGLLIMLAGFAVCFMIRPELLEWSTAFSDFGNDVRTAPYLAASLFFGAYGLWRWRHYLRRTLKRARPVTGLVALTVGGLYLAALMPMAWTGWPYRLHILGVIIAGTSAATTVVVDTLLTKVRGKKAQLRWRLLRFCSFVLIVVGGYITFGSTPAVNWFDYSLLGEAMMLLGYGLWIIDKTYRGEGGRSQLSRLLHKIVLID